jgi:cation diffusion facilitator CzcD-associated flavoprotein CzcO
MVIFKAIRIGKASVVTDHIDRFTAKGIVLKSGQNEADIIITATGLDLIALEV